jgi:hypothetical protein
MSVFLSKIQHIAGSLRLEEGLLVFLLFRSIDQLSVTKRLVQMSATCRSVASSNRASMEATHSPPIKTKSKIVLASSFLGAEFSGLRLWSRFGRSDGPDIFC